MSYRDDDGYSNDEGCYTCGSRRHSQFNCDYEPSLIGPPTFETYMELRVKLEAAISANEERIRQYRERPDIKRINADVERQVAAITAARRARRETHPLPAWQKVQK